MADEARGQGTGTVTRYELQPGVESEPNTIERRRPGRIENPSPELIELMRAPSALKADQAAADWLAEPETGPDCSVDDLHPSRGIILGVMIGAALWGLIAFGLWWLCGAVWSMA